MNAIEVRGLVFGWPGFRLEVEDWSVPVGAVAGVMGPSGCGKSTLLALLSGERVAQPGMVRIGGVDPALLDETGRRARRLARVGLVLQEHPLVDHLDVLDNVLLPYRLGALRRGPAEEARARALLEALGVGALARRAPATLSTGERQRVALARALVTGPELVLADEPTSGLDPAAARGVMALLEEATRARGTTLVMVTHDPSFAPRFAPLLTLGAP